MLRRVIAYSNQIFGLQKLMQSVSDSREKPRIPTHVICLSVWILFTARLKSLNELEQYRHLRSWKKWMNHSLPCADEIIYVSERIDLDSVREVLAKIYSRLKRNKVLEPLGGWSVGAVDGHEIGCSYDRCCNECLQRKIEVNSKTRIQYYHRIVVFEILGEKYRLLLDAELVKPGEDEIGAAERLIERVLKRFPRAFDVLTGDALYVRASLFRLLQKHGKYAVMVLKDDRRDLVKDVKDLCKVVKPEKVEEGSKVSYQWDIENLKTWSQFEDPVRVVRSLETKVERKRTGGEWIEKTSEHDWIWITNLPKNIVSTAKVVRWGHARWQIENEGFNELATKWNANHYFHHHPVSIMVFWLILFVAHAIFHCFWLRNLKPQIKRSHTVIYWALQIAAFFRRDQWWPVPT